jgi:hypothetical protein
MVAGLRHLTFDISGLPAACPLDGMVMAHCWKRDLGDDKHRLTLFNDVVCSQ